MKSESDGLGFESEMECGRAEIKKKKKEMKYLF